MSDLATVATASTTAPSTPSRQRVAVGYKRGNGPLVVELPQSENDRRAHDLASYVRPSARRVAPAVTR